MNALALSGSKHHYGWQNVLGLMGLPVKMGWIELAFLTY